MRGGLVGFYPHKGAVGAWLKGHDGVAAALGHLLQSVERAWLATLHEAREVLAVRRAVEYVGCRFVVCHDASWVVC